MYTRDQLWLRLDHILDLAAEVKSDARVLDTLREEIGLQSTGGADQTGSRPIGHVSDSVSVAAMRLYDMEQALREKRAVLRREQDALQEQINRMPTAVYRNLILCRYILLMTWSKTARALSYDVRHVYRVYDSALEELLETVNASLDVM